MKIFFMAAFWLLLLFHLFYVLSPEGSGAKDLASILLLMLALAAGFSTFFTLMSMWEDSEK